jgi:hypothetical protein
VLWGITKAVMMGDSERWKVLWEELKDPATVSGKAQKWGKRPVFQ